jgi:type III secretion protein U
VRAGNVQGRRFMAAKTGPAVSEKTEPATDKKLEKAREKGQVAHSKELASASAFFFGIVALLLTAAESEERVRAVLQHALLATSVPAGDRVAAALHAAGAMVTEALWIVVPVLAAALVGSIVGGVAHVGFNFSFDPLTPKPEKINPVDGVKRIFSLRSLFEVFKSVVIAVVVGWLIYESVRSLLPILVFSGYGEPTSIGLTAWNSLLRLMLPCAGLFIVLGVVDYVVQRQLFLKEQKMSKDDVKREWKEDEGDPQLKGERKALAREIAFSSPTAAVSTANVVVVNPTHYAVALRYAPEECGLPVVVARGVDADAAAIRAAADEAGVPIIGNPPLARALYAAGDNATVPEPLLEAVAAVLRWAQQVRA